MIRFLTDFGIVAICKTRFFFGSSMELGEEGYAELHALLEVPWGADRANHIKCLQFFFSKKMVYFQSMSVCQEKFPKKSPCGSLVRMNPFQVSKRKHG